MRMAASISASWSLGARRQCPRGRAGGPDFASELATSAGSSSSARDEVRAFIRALCAYGSLAWIGSLARYVGPSPDATPGGAGDRRRRECRVHLGPVKGVRGRVPIGGDREHDADHLPVDVHHR